MEPATRADSKLFELFGVTVGQASHVLHTACEGGAREGIYSDLYFQKGGSEVLQFGESKLLSTEGEEICGAGVYVVIGEKRGYAPCDEVTIENLMAAAKDAGSIAKYGAAVVKAPPKGVNESRDLYSIGNSPLLVNLVERMKLLRKVDEAARGHDARIKNVMITLWIEDHEIVFHNTFGALLYDSRPLVRIKIICIADDGKNKAKAAAGGGGRYDFDFFTRNDLWKKYAVEAAQEAVDNLDAVNAPVGETEVVLGSGWSGVLMHEAVGHGLEGDFNRQGLSAFSGRVGEMVASPECTIVDDGTLPGERGALNFDDEGNKTRKNVLVENGRLIGYMHDRMNAGLMGVEPTGNGRRQDYRHPPIPRMTGTYLDNGKHTPEEIIRSVNKGLYIKAFGGGMVDITTGKFVFDAEGVFEIEEGRLGRRIKDATLIGNGPAVLPKISMVGNDLSLDPGIGTCGKDGQGVPVNVGMPHIRVRMTVGGQEG
jgi:TldD protein